MNSLSFTYGYKLEDLGQVSKLPVQPKCSAISFVILNKSYHSRLKKSFMFKVRPSRYSKNFISKCSGITEQELAE